MQGKEIEERERERERTKTFHCIVIAFTVSLHKEVNETKKCKIAIALSVKMK